MPSPVPVSVRMPPELKEALSALAAADKRPLSNYVMLVLEEHVKGRQPPAEPRKPRASARRARE
jgi:hypothetical protein